MASVTKNIAFNSAYQLTKILIPLVTVPYLSRTLGPDGVGTYSYTYSITNYFVMAAMLGMSTYGVRLVAYDAGDREKLSVDFCNAYASQVLVGTLALVAYLAYCLTLAQGGILICLLWLPWIVSALLDVSWLLFGMENFKATSIRSMAVALAQMLLIFLLVHNPGDLPVYVGIISFGFLVSQLVVWPFAPKYIDFKKPSLHGALQHLAPSIRLFVPVIAISLYAMFDKVVLGAISGTQEVGYYEYAYKIITVPLAFITAFGTVMLPKMSSVFGSGDDESAYSLLDNAMWYMQAIAMAFAFGVGAVAYEFVPVFLGGEFAPSTALMIVLAAIMPAVSASNVIGRQYLLPKSKDGQYTASVLLGAALNLIVIFVLIPALGAMGAAIGTTVAEYTVLIAQCVFVRKNLPLRRYCKNTLPFVVIGVLMTAAIRISVPVLGAIESSVVALILEVLIGAVTYTAFTIIYCKVSRDEHYDELKGWLSSKLPKKASADA